MSPDANEPEKEKFEALVATTPGGLAVAAFATTAAGQLAVLRDELAAATTPYSRAVLNYEIGHLIEHDHGDASAAAHHYVAAFNDFPRFRLPLFALVRIYERKRSLKNLSRLYAAESSTAANPLEKASALMDRAALLEEQGTDTRGAQELLVRALDEDPSSLAASLMLERSYRRSSRASLADSLVRDRVAHVVDPWLRASLESENAYAAEVRGEVDVALAAATEAASAPVFSWRFLLRLERLARRHDRPSELAIALEGRAAIVESIVNQSESGEVVGVPHSLRDAPHERLSQIAADLFREAARVRVALGERGAADALYERALVLAPSHRVTRLERALHAELTQPSTTLLGDVSALLSTADDNDEKLILEWLAVEAHRATGDVESAASALRRAQEIAPDSAVLALLREDLSVNPGDATARIASLVARGEDETTPISERVQAWFAAAALAVDEVRDASLAKEAYDGALRAGAPVEEVLREVYVSALQLDEPALRLHAIDALLELPLEDDERAAFLHEHFEIAREQLGDEALAKESLSRAVSDDAARAWAPDLCRVEGSLADPADLAVAYERLSEHASDPSASLAYRLARARLLARNGLHSEAISALEAVLKTRPGLPFAFAMLSELLKQQGASESLLALVKNSARDEDAAKKSSERFFRLGAEAELQKNFAAATRAYEEAVDLDPDSRAPLQALLRLAVRTGNSALGLEAREVLAQRELDRGQDVWDSLELAEHYLTILKKPELAHDLIVRALGDDTGVFAAALLALDPALASRPEDWQHAFDRLAEDAEPEQRRELALGLFESSRSRGGAFVEVPGRGEDLAVPERKGELVAALFASQTLEHRAATLNALAGVTDDPSASLNLRMEELFARLSSGQRDIRSASCVVADDLAKIAPRSAESAFANDFAGAGTADARGRAAALRGRVAHATLNSAYDLEATAARLLTEVGDTQQSLQDLRAIVRRDPADFASWDALRVAARAEQSWADVVRACDALLEVTEGDFYAELCEEAALLCLERLRTNDEGERFLRSALRISPSRPLAYRRLHDLLRERKDSVALLALIDAAIRSTDDVEWLSILHVDLALAHSLRSEPAMAMEALDLAVSLDEKNLDACALMVDVCVSLERFDRAVSALRTIAAGARGANEKRTARMRAAELLADKLGDPAGAIAELQKLDEDNCADRSSWMKLAEIALSVSDHEHAAEAYENASRFASPADGNTLHRRAADAWLRAEKPENAAQWYREALLIDSADAVALAALSAIPGGAAELSDIQERFKERARLAVYDDPLNPEILRNHLRAAVLADNPLEELTTLDILSAFGFASAEDANRLAMLRARLSSPLNLPHANIISHLRTDGYRPDAELVFRMVARSMNTVDEVQDALAVERAEEFRSAGAPVFAELQRVAALFAARVGSVRWLQSSSEDISLRQHGTTEIWCVSTSCRAPLSSEAKYFAGRAAYACASGFAALLAQPRERWISGLCALFRSAEMDPPQGLEVAAQSAPLRVSLRDIASAEEYERLCAAFETLSDSRRIEQHVRAAMRASHRAGLIASLDLRAALSHVLGQAPTRDAARLSVDAKDLLAYWALEAPKVLAAIGAYK